MRMELDRIVWQTRNLHRALEMEDRQRLRRREAKLRGTARRTLTMGPVIVLDVLSLDLPVGHAAAGSAFLDVRDTSGARLARDLAFRVDDGARDKHGPEEVERDFVVREQGRERR